jgi:ribosomal protein S25
MAHREQHGNKEKKKPKQEKNTKDKASSAPFVQPELVRKPHKGKPQ